jgi:Arc/MetJ-type ribon-helix-helix transcriptional regulator
MTEEKVKVELPKSIIEKIKKRINGTGFESVSSYIAYVLDEILNETDDDSDDFTDEDEKKVKERLRALGYLD